MTCTCFSMISSFLLFSVENCTDFPQVLCKLPSLVQLDLRYQGFHSLPPSIANLRKLSEFWLSNCPLLETLPASLGSLTFENLTLDECPSLKTPPREIVEQGSNAVVAYLRRLQSGSVTCKRTKLMFVGLGGAGKTRYVLFFDSFDFNCEFFGVF